MEDFKIVQLIDIACRMQGQEFVWGENDCNMIAVMSSDILHDTEIAVDHFRTYSTERGAIRKSKKVNALNLLKQAGYKKVKKNHEQFGDVLIVKEKKWFCTHVYLGSGKVLSSLPETGVCITKIDMSSSYKTYRMVK